jgi:hypothetical protein
MLPLNLFGRACGESRELPPLGTGQKFFNDFSELVWISIYAKSLKSLANLAETVPFGPSNVARGFPGPAPKGI